MQLKTTLTLVVAIAPPIEAVVVDAAPDMAHATPLVASLALQAHPVVAVLPIAPAIVIVAVLAPAVPVHRKLPAEAPPKVVVIVAHAPVPVAVNLVPLLV